VVNRKANAKSVVRDKSYRNPIEREMDEKEILYCFMGRALHCCPYFSQILTNSPNYIVLENFPRISNSIFLIDHIDKKRREEEEEEGLLKIFTLIPPTL
jgi:hypothetical protein